MSDYEEEVDEVLKKDGGYFLVRWTESSEESWVSHSDLIEYENGLRALELFKAEQARKKKQGRNKLSVLEQIDTPSFDSTPLAALPFDLWIEICSASEPEMKRRLRLVCHVINRMCDLSSEKKLTIHIEELEYMARLDPLQIHSIHITGEDTPVFINTKKRIASKLEDVANRMQFIGRCSNLKQLRIDLFPRFAQFDWFYGLKNLESLIVEKNESSDNINELLPRLPNLTTVIWPDILPNIPENLKELGCSTVPSPLNVQKFNWKLRYDLTRNYQNPLHAPHLTSLTLDFYCDQNQGWEHAVSNFPNLEHLGLHVKAKIYNLFSYYSPTLHWIKTYTKLKSFSWSVFESTTTYARIQLPPSVQRVEAICCCSDQNFRIHNPITNFQEITDLQELHLGNTIIPEAITGCSELQVLTFENSVLPDDAYAIGLYRNLKINTFRLRYDSPTSGQPSASVISYLLTALGDVPLECLEISHVHLNKKAIKLLANLRGLRTLRLIHCQLDSGSLLLDVASMPKLRYFGLRGSTGIDPVTTSKLSQILTTTIDFGM